jgi:hypothetical protein
MGMVVHAFHKAYQWFGHLDQLDHLQLICRSVNIGEGGKSENMYTNFDGLPGGPGVPGTCGKGRKGSFACAMTYKTSRVAAVVNVTIRRACRMGHGRFTILLALLYRTRLLAPRAALDANAIILVEFLRQSRPFFARFSALLGASARLKIIRWRHLEWRRKVFP